MVKSEVKERVFQTRPILTFSSLGYLVFVITKSFLESISASLGTLLHSSVFFGNFLHDELVELVCLPVYLSESSQRLL